MLCVVEEPKCRAGTCQPLYQGEEHNIFFLSDGLGIGVEMFWDFLGWLQWGSMSFSKFCKQISFQYVTNHPRSASFVSNHTFIDLFFAWLVAFQVDFRHKDNVDPFCGYDPKCLGCDGVHIGVSIKNLLLEHPITKPELDHVHKPLHKRNDRCFLPYGQKGTLKGSQVKGKKEETRNARAFLFSLVQQTLKGEGNTTVSLQAGRDLLFSSLAWSGWEGFSDLLIIFLDRSAPQQVLRAIAQLLKLLLTKCHPASCVLPFRFIEHLHSCCDSVEADTLTHQQLEEMCQYSTEMATLIKLTHNNSNCAAVLKFFRELAKFVLFIHSQDRPAGDGSPIPGTYNPPSGTAYYFTPHGQQIRECPHYEDEKLSKDACTKLYPLTSFGGFGYMFLFFCPQHGHCYGFHLIDGGEGRKDPFSALYKYKPTPPQEIFYDAACLLFEYGLNREPDYFKYVRIWHDLFHGVNHVCQPCFHSKRVLGLSGINTEICEQFNSYLKSIKFTGSHLSQIHFMLFAQFMILLWNRDKTDKFKAIASVAVAGMQ